MKKLEHIKIAEQIGDDSWELIHYTSLPKNASRAKQTEALRRDQEWLLSHIQEVSHSIDELIGMIEP